MNMFVKLTRSLKDDGETKLLIVYAITSKYIVTSLSK